MPDLHKEPDSCPAGTQKVLDQRKAINRMLLYTHRGLQAFTIADREG
jgi:hypothetical protein